MNNNFIAIHHASMIISNLVKSKHFYHEILGLAIDDSRPDLSFDGLWLNINENQQIHLLLVDNPDPFERPLHGGRDRHTAFRVKELSLIQMRLDKYEVSYTLSKSGRKALFCRDPDGNTLEIME
ncbi:MAG: VOC family protein [Cocleimonas sp.]|nr:VOC family protein [Cocleimonas sp.]